MTLEMCIDTTKRSIGVILKYYINFESEREHDLPVLNI